MKIGKEIFGKGALQCKCLVIVLISTNFIFILIATGTLLELTEYSINIPVVVVLAFSSITHPVHTMFG